MRALLIVGYLWASIVAGTLYRDDYARVSNGRQATAIQTVIMAAGWPVMGVFFVGPALTGGSFFDFSNHESTKTK
jgi:hypothetical protein